LVIAVAIGLPIMPITAIPLAACRRASMASRHRLLALVFHFHAALHTLWQFYIVENKWKQETIYLPVLPDTVLVKQSNKLE
jgi:hypothetical protein